MFFETRGLHYKRSPTQTLAIEKLASERHINYFCHNESYSKFETENGLSLSCKSPNLARKIKRPSKSLENLCPSLSLCLVHFHFSPAGARDVAWKTGAAEGKISLNSFLRRNSPLACSLARLQGLTSLRRERWWRRRVHFLFPSVGG